MTARPLSAVGLLVADPTGRLASRLGRPAVVRADTDGAVAAVRAGGRTPRSSTATSRPRAASPPPLRLAAQGAAVVLATAATEPAALAAALRAGARAVVGLDADATLLELAVAAARGGPAVRRPAGGGLPCGCCSRLPTPLPAALPARARGARAACDGSGPGRVAPGSASRPRRSATTSAAIVAKLDVPDAAAAGRLARSAGLGLG